MNTKPHIIIHIEGGVCQGVYCNDARAEIEVIDIDNAKAGEPSDRKHAEARLEWAGDKLALLA